MPRPDASAPLPFFLSSGEGNWESEAPGRMGGGRLVIENPGGGGVLILGGGRGCKGSVRSCGELVNWGGGPNIFFWGAKIPSKLLAGAT